MTAKTTIDVPTNSKPTTVGKNMDWGKFRNESKGLVFAEGASIATSLLTVAIVDKLAPHLVKSASKTVGKVVIEPHLDAIEKGMSYLCRLEECKIDKDTPREERAEKLAHAILMFIPAFTLSWTAKILARKWSNKKWGIDTNGHHNDAPKWQFWKHMTPHDWKVVAFDEGIHLGSVIGLNTVGAKYSDEMLRGVRGVLKKIGFSDQQSNDVATVAVVWEFPNLIGLAASLIPVSQRHYK